MDGKEVVAVNCPAAPVPEPRKRWEPPTIEEIDYGATEGGAGIYTPGDFATYST